VREPAVSPFLDLPPTLLRAEVAARLWCESLSRTLEGRRIKRGAIPYLDRYYVSGMRRTVDRPGGAVYLHHFLTSDPDAEVHSHPWDWSASLILVGGYREQRCTAAGGMVERVYQPGDVNVLRADDRHRIDLLGNDCWSLFLAGTYQQPWGFSKGCEEHG
jgi:hypothetical protein